MEETSNTMAKTQQESNGNTDLSPPSYTATALNSTPHNESAANSDVPLTTYIPDNKPSELTTAAVEEFGTSISPAAVYPPPSSTTDATSPPPVATTDATPPRPYAGYTLTTSIFTEPKASSGQAPPMPPTYLPFTIFVMMCCCTVLGILARRAGAQVAYFHQQKKYSDAKAASRNALYYNLIGLVLGLIIWPLVLGGSIAYLVVEVESLRATIESDL